ncbi:MAG: DUF4230 domain-containing protein [Ardenticatenales bacterium]
MSDPYPTDPDKPTLRTTARPAATADADVPTLRTGGGQGGAGGGHGGAGGGGESGRRPNAALPWLTGAAALLVAALGALAIVAAVLVFGLYRRGGAFLDDLSGAFGPRPAPTAAIDTKSVVVEKLQDAAELTSLVYTLETVVSASQDRSLAGFKIGSTELLYIAHGQVRAGIDLAKLGDEDVDIEGGAGIPIGAADGIVIHLPAPEILGATLDVDKSRVYDLRESLFAPVAPDLQSRAERYALQRIVGSACDADILSAANDRAADAVRALLTAAGAVDVTVRTRKAGRCAWDGAAATEPTAP